MRFLFCLLVSAITTTSYACPQLAGFYKCHKQSLGEQKVISVQISQKDDQFIIKKDLIGPHSDKSNRTLNGRYQTTQNIRLGYDFSGDGELFSYESNNFCTQDSLNTAVIAYFGYVNMWTHSNLIYSKNAQGGLIYTTNNYNDSQSIVCTK